MKRKILSILLTLVLVLSFSLVTAVPVAAQTLGDVSLKAEGNGIADWSVDNALSGSYSAKLIGGTQTGSDYAAIVMPMVGTMTLSEVTDFVYKCTFESAGNWGPHVCFYTHDPVDGETADITWSSGIAGGTPPTANQGENTMTVTSATSQFFWWGDEDDSVLTQGQFPNVYTFGDFQVDPVFSTHVIDRIQIEYGWWSIGDASEPAYVDDVTLNGVPYDLDWTHVSSIQVDDDRAQYTDAPFQTIQGAIDCAIAEDTISVAPGTYNENIVVNKTLTLEGARVGENARGRTGPESIIDAQGVPIAVLINGEETIATFDGFTVTNFVDMGIKAVPDPLESKFTVHILNNIVEAPSSMGAADNYNIWIGIGTTGTVIGNEVSGALLEDPAAPRLLGIHVLGSDDVFISNNYVHDCGVGVFIMGAVAHATIPPAEDNIIESNLVENCKTGIYVYLNSIDTIIRYNDVLNNDVGIERTKAPSTLLGTEIHYNNIVGNKLYGVKSSIEEVDATYNWWDDVTGPEQATLNPGAQGNAVSKKVDFSPWLYKTQENFVSDAPCYAGSVVLGNEATQVEVEPVSYAGGWNSFSTPVTLDGSADYISELLALTTESDLSIVRAQRFDLASQEWVDLVMGGALTGDDYQIKPGEGFFIQVSTKGSLPILCRTSSTSPPRTDLVAGWNLVGLSNLTKMSVANALNNVDYSVVLSASPPNAATWSVPPATDTGKNMWLGEAYWLGMGQPGILFGHTTTPVAEGMTWGLNQ